MAKRLHLGSQTKDLIMTKKTKKTKKRKAAPKRAAKASRKPKIKMRKGTIARKIKNRRSHRRIMPKNLWVTEFSGDYQYIAQAGDLSEGGIFLKNRFKSENEASQLVFKLGKLGSIELEATPLYDRRAGTSFGTGYRFTRVTSNQAKALRSFLRNFN
jgi:hypothetical protein